MRISCLENAIVFGNSYAILRRLSPSDFVVHSVTPKLRTSSYVFFVTISKKVSFSKIDLQLDFRRFKNTVKLRLIMPQFRNYSQ